VLAARLSDARFFWQQDVKVPLEEQAKKLEQIVFHEKLGTVADKVERVAKLARWLVEQQIVTPAKAGVQPNEKLGSRVHGNDEEVAALAERAALLAKADLVTGMVGEFPELQGVIGGYLARAQGEDDAVAAAIRDHYKPVGQGDEVPTAPITVAVSLADKLDTIYAFFVADERPTGSKDPFAVRRAALSTIQLLVSRDLRFNLNSILDFLTPILFNQMHTRAEKMLNFRQLEDDGYAPAIGFSQDNRKLIVFFGESESYEIDLEPSQVGFAKAYMAAMFGDRINDRSVLNFLVDRLKVQQREAGVRHDLIDAVFALGGEEDLVRLLARVKALQAFVETGEGANLLAGYKRAANILKKEEWDTSAVSDAAVLPDEAALMVALDTAEPKAEAALTADDYTGAMAALASLRAPIDAFFEQVIVNDLDASVRARRLDLLARFRDAVHRVADFSRIEG